MIHFLLLAFFYPSGTVGQNFTGSCPLRPVNNDTSSYRMCFPNEARSFQMGDEIMISGINANGKKNYVVQFNLGTETLIHFHLSIRSAQKSLVFNSWHSQGHWRYEQKYPFNPAQFEGPNVWHRIKNTPEGITFELGDCKDKPYVGKYIYRHRVPNPETDYPFFHIHKPTTMEIGAVYYCASNSSNYEEIQVSKELWKWE